MSITSPKQPKPIAAQPEQPEAGNRAALENLDQVRDPDGQKAEAAELYAKSVGKKPGRVAQKAPVKGK